MSERRISSFKFRFLFRIKHLSPELNEQQAHELH
jgi:hypothetical protein